MLAEKRTESQARDLVQAAGLLGLHHKVEMSEVREANGVRTKAELGEDLRNKLSGAVKSGPANG